MPAFCLDADSRIACSQEKMHYTCKLTAQLEDRLMAPTQPGITKVVRQIDRCNNHAVAFLNTTDHLRMLLNLPSKPLYDLSQETPESECAQNGIFLAHAWHSLTSYRSYSSRLH